MSIDLNNSQNPAAKPIAQKLWSLVNWPGSIVQRAVFKADGASKLMERRQMETDPQELAARISRLLDEGGMVSASTIVVEVYEGDFNPTVLTFGQGLSYDDWKLVDDR